MASDPERMKILHAPRDIGSNAYHLARGERALGFDSHNLVYFKQWYGYPSDIDLKMKVDDNPVHYYRWWWLMARVALTCDVLHFNFGSSFLHYYPKRWIYPDVSLWRKLGIATFVTFQGCEGRVASYVMGNLEHKFCTNCRSREFCGGGYDDYKLEANSVVGRYFDGVYALNPDIVRCIPSARFMPYVSTDINAWQPPEGFDWHHDGPVKVVHAPTNREIKGTDAVVSTVESLKAEGLNLELVLVEKIPHNQVRQLYESADLLVDQLLIGWYGGLAVELMALGKPVVAYIRQEDLRFIPTAMKEDLPIVSANPETLRDTLKELIRDSERRRQIGQRSRAFVEKWHDPKVIGRMTTDAYRKALAKRPRFLTRTERLSVLFKLCKPTVRYFGLLYSNNSLAGLMSRKMIKLVKENLKCRLPKMFN
jgi:glycosyltransferase involved in cell wall biosynthesis